MEARFRNSSGTIFDVLATNLLDFNQWQHLAFIYDGSNIHLYKDGVLISSTPANGMIMQSAQSFRLAGLDFQTDVFHMNGRLDEVRLWDVALSQADINNWMCIPIDLTHPNYNNLMGYWRLNEGVGTTTADLSLNGNNGSLNNNPTWQVTTSCFGSTVTPLTYVPDDNFENYLEANGMGNGIANDDYVTTANIDTVTYLDVSQNNITNLTGIESFTALTSLNCHHNEIFSLDLSQNTDLTLLNCSINLLTTLNVSNNTALTYLDCSINALTSLDVSQNTALTSLFCISNQLTSLDLRNGNNTNFTYFWVSNNSNLTCINVDDPVWSATNWTGIDPWSSFSYSCGAPQTYVPDDNFEQALITLGYDNVLDDSVITANINTVTNLDISSINIYDLTGIEDFTSLTHLDCSGNQLIMIDISNNTNLTTLSCVGNQLTSLDLSQNVNLDTLNCNGNLLTSLDLNYNTAISELSVGFNNPMIIDFSMLLNLKSLWFYNLLELDLSNNSILENLGGGWNDQYLSYVNIQNGNNVNLTCDGVLPLSCESFKNHQNLTCIQVDDVSWANTNWIDNLAWNGSPAIDTTFQYFSTNCALPTLIEEHTTNKELLKVTDLLGRETKETNHPIFYIYDDGTVEKKIIVE